GECLAVVAFSVPSAAGRRDVTDEAEGVGLASTSPQPAGERQGLLGVAPGLVNPPGQEIDYPRAQQNERRPAVTRATAELLDGARHQRERFVRPAGEGVGYAEDRGKDRRRVDELPRAAVVKAPLEEPRSPWEITAAEVGEAETEQPVIQGERMIGRFRDLHGGLGVPDGLVEPAELGEHV